MGPRVLQALGATLANWSSLQFEVGDFLALREFTDPASGARQLDDETIERILTRPGHERLACGHAIAHGRGEATRGIPLPLALPGLPLLQSMVATVSLIEAAAAVRVNARDLRLLSLDVLREAVLFTESAGQWTHAARQLGHLATETVKVDPDADVTGMLGRALEYAARTSDYGTIAELQAQLAERAVRKGATAMAAEHAREAGRAAIRALVRRGEHGEASHQETLALIADLALRCARAGESAGPCIALAESMRAVSLSVSMTRDMSFLHAPIVAASRERAAELRKQRQELLAAEVRPSVEGPSTGTLLGLERAIEETRREGVLRDSRYVGWGDSTRADVADTRELLRALSDVGPHATYVGCFPAQGTIWTYAIWDGGELVAQSPWPHWRGHVCRMNPLDPERPSLDSSKLTDWSTALISLLAARLTSLPMDAPVVISAGAPLDWLPFAALSLQGRPLCERVRIHRVQGLGVLDACRRRPPAKMASLLAVGAPVRADADPLPATRIEVKGIAGVFQRHARKARTLLGRQATVSALAELAPGADVLHFACHAARPFEGAPESALLLTGDSSDDGLLDASTVLHRLDLVSGCFVNLAACDSAAQGEAFGPAAVGLVPALLMKGARCVLGSLWPLFDKSAARFSDAFYDELLCGHSPAAALAKVQRRCLAGAFGSEMAEPEIWGAYALYGLG